MDDDESVRRADAIELGVLGLLLRVARVAVEVEDERQRAARRRVRRQVHQRLALAAVVTHQQHEVARQIAEPEPRQRVGAVARQRALAPAPHVEHARRQRELRAAEDAEDRLVGPPHQGRSPQAGERAGAEQREEGLIPHSGRFSSYLLRRPLSPSTRSITGSLSHVRDDVNRQVLGRRALGAVPGSVASARTLRFGEQALVTHARAAVPAGRFGAHRIATVRKEALVRLGWIAPGVLQLTATGDGHKQREQCRA